MNIFNNERDPKIDPLHAITMTVMGVILARLLRPRKIIEKTPLPIRKADAINIGRAGLIRESLFFLPASREIKMAPKEIHASENNAAPINAPMRFVE